MRRNKKTSTITKFTGCTTAGLRPCFLYIRCYDEILHTHSHTGVTGMSVLDSSQYLLTLQQPLFRPGAQQEMKWVHSEPSLSNKDLRCGDVTSWQPCNSVWCGVSVGGQGGEAIPHWDGHRSEETGEERGLLMSTEAGGCCGQSQCGCLVYRAHFLLGLLQRSDVIAQQLLTWIIGHKVKRQNRDIEGVLGEGQNSTTIKMSVRSL